MNIKSDLKSTLMEGAAMVPKLLHLSSTAGTKILLPFSTYTSFLMPIMWHFNL